jgi:hypothetical protein
MNGPAHNNNRTNIFQLVCCGRKRPELTADFVAQNKVISKPKQSSIWIGITWNKTMNKVAVGSLRPESGGG